MCNFRIRCPCCGECFGLLSGVVRKIKALLSTHVGAAPNLYLYDEDTEYGVIPPKTAKEKGGG